jgi:DNA-binding beta-propeller fold protein YncE
MKRTSVSSRWVVVANLVMVFAAATLLISGVRAAELTFRPADNWAQFPPGATWQTMTAVDIDSKGVVYVLQRGEPSKVMAFDSTGRLLRSWGQGRFPSAHGLRVDRQDNVWVTDRSLQQVLKFSPQGKLLMALGTKGVQGNNESKDALNGPSDVVIAPNGDIFVSDGESTNTRIVKYAKDGQFIKFWGSKGPEPGQLDVPHSIVMNSKGQLYVADRSNKRVEIFDQNGRYLDQMSNVGTPYGLFMTKGDVLYVVDGTQRKERLTIVDAKDKKVLDHFEGGLEGAHMLAVDSAGSIYVAEVRGKSVKKFVRN